MSAAGGVQFVIDVAAPIGAKAFIGGRRKNSIRNTALVDFQRWPRFPASMSAEAERKTKQVRTAKAS